jgi:DNA invertase Pin-like site-specific DNA recombinase
MAWSVDRPGRSLQDLVGFLSELHALKIDLFLRRQGLDTTTPAGKALFQMMGVFDEFEREMIAERVRAGLERARAEGTPGAFPITPTRKQSDPGLPAGPVCALPNSSKSILGQCRASAALSLPQASPPPCPSDPRPSCDQT